MCQRPVSTVALKGLSNQRLRDYVLCLVLGSLRPSEISLHVTLNSAVWTSPVIHCIVFKVGVTTHAGQVHPELPDFIIKNSVD